MGYKQTLLKKKSKLVWKSGAQMQKVLQRTENWSSRRAGTKEVTHSWSQDESPAFAGSLLYQTGFSIRIN